MTSAPTSPRSAVGAWTVAVATVVLGGFVSLFVAFLFAYGFQDRVGPAQHVVFLVLLASSVVLLGTIAGLITSVVLSGRVRLGIRFGLRASLAAHLLALALGTVVSLANEDQNSVTADQADWPFHTLVVLALLGSVVSARWASRSLRIR